MELLSFIRTLLDYVFRRSRIEREMDDEFRSHVKLRAAELERQGLSRTDAGRRARIEFGGYQKYKDECREALGTRLLQELFQDVRYGLRQLRRNPGFAIVAVLTLALGIGANTAIFTVVNAVLLKPLAYPHADRIVKFQMTWPRGSFGLLAIPEFHILQRQTGVFQNVAAYDFLSPGFNLTGDHPEQLQGIHVTEGFFRLFGAPVILGRTFTPQEDSPHCGKVVLISYGLWQSRFGGDPTVIGRSLSLSDETYTIIGVIGKNFPFEPEADVWVPFQFDPASNDMNHFIQVAGRLKPGITLAQVQAQLTLAATQLHLTYPKTKTSREGFAAEPLRDSIVAGARRSLLILLGAVGLVLLIACANVANLSLVRATGRRREFVIRAAIGGGGARTIRQLLTESVLLSAAGGILGLAIGFAGVRALLALNPAGLPVISGGSSALNLDWRVVSFTLAASLLAGILFGSVPALSASRLDLNSALKGSSNRSGGGFRQSKARSLLVINEVSLALVLLIGSVLLIRSFLALQAVNPGFDSHHVLTLEMSLTGARFQKTAAVAQLSKDGRDRLNAIPGLEVSATTVWLPNWIFDGSVFQIVGRPVEDGQGAHWTSASPGYLRVFKIPILHGRDFRETDTTGAPGVVIVNQAFVSQFFPNQNPVGQQIILDPGSGFYEEPPREIIGVIGNTSNAGLAFPTKPMVIVPEAQVPDGYTAAYSDTSPVFWVVRTRGDPHQYIAAITRQLRLASGGFPVGRVRTMDEVMGNSTAQQSFNMLLLTLFAALALVLAAIGIYGIMAYSAQQGTREIGIRMALGAQRSDVLRMVIGQGLKLALIGVVIGIVGALAISRFLTSLLYGVKPTDPLTFITVSLILVAVALLACYIPARRASKVDPMVALRYE
jgi:putative ABC transport system permease protein